MGRLTEFFDYLSDGTGHYWKENARYYWINVDMDLEVEVAEYQRLCSEQGGLRNEEDIE